jgi:hypothetical protein
MQQRSLRGARAELWRRPGIEEENAALRHEGDNAIDKEEP